MAGSHPSMSPGGRASGPAAGLRVARGVALLAGLVLALLAAPAASASPPGSLRGAAGDGHLWWAVERVAPEVPGRSRAGERAGFMLMHHASVEPAPTERFVLPLDSEPEAMAAEGNAVALILRAEGERKRLVLLTRAERNQAVGHWYSEPRTGPKVLAPLESRGRIVDLAMAGGTLYVVRLVQEDDGADRLEMLSLAQDAGADWLDAPLPPLDGVGAAEEARWRLVRDGATLCALGFDGGSLAIARFVEGEWQVEPLPGIKGADVVGAFSLEGRIVLVERARGMSGNGGNGTGRAEIRLSIVRLGRTSAWVRFEEPVGDWMVAAFGSDAALLELDESGRGVVRGIRSSGNTPLEPVTLAPPGFASGQWVHLPIIGTASLALMLATLMVLAGRDASGSKGAGDSRASRAPRPMGVPLSRRLLAFTVDAAPGFLLAWAILGGNPLRFFEHPFFSTSIDAAMPGIIVLAGGWIVGAVGDVAFGRSMGKRLIGLDVVAPDGSAASRGRRLVRSLVALITVFSPFTMLVAYAHPWCDGPAEILSGTAVIDARTPQVPPRAPGGEDG